jgi:hypothetical protein
MSERRYVARHHLVAARRLGDETMIVSGLDSNVITLNEVATIIWEAADGTTPLDEIVERRICAEFEIQPGEALRDAEELVETLAACGILVVSVEPIRASNPLREEIA